MVFKRLPCRSYSRQLQLVIEVSQPDMTSQTEAVTHEHVSGILQLMIAAERESQSIRADCLLSICESLYRHCVYANGQ